MTQRRFHAGRAAFGARRGGRAPLVCPARLGGLVRLLGCSLLVVVAAAQAQEPAGAERPAAVTAVTPATAADELEARLDVIVRQGEDRIPAALGQIDTLAAQAATAGPAAQRALALARAELAARGTDAALATRQRALAVTAARALDAGLAAADELYLQALRAARDDTAMLAESARRALSAYEASCKTAAPPPATSAAAATATAASATATTPAAPAAAPACEYRRRWRLQQQLANQARLQHAAGAARGHARAALNLALAGSDSWRQAWSETELAMVANQDHELERAQQHLAQAQQIAARHDDPRLAARLLFTEASLAADRGDGDRAQQALQQALLAARQASSPRLEAQAWNNLSDRALYTGRPADALSAALQGQALAAPLQLPHIERVLRNNAMLARVALGRQAEARRDFEALQAAWAADGATGMQVTSLREYSDALAQAGELKAALEMHHRERALTEALMAANRDAALAELRTRYDREAQQRNILQLERDNALKSAELANRGLSRKLWALGAGVLALAMTLLLLLVRRVRETNRRLERSHASLRVASERDALTGLANRRHFQAVLQAENQQAEFNGALLMVDIDHFKRINDEHGHAVGDSVLVEVARRVAAAVRGKDTVARWGGEEFLVLAPGLQRQDTDALAQRLLQAVAGAPVVLPTGVPLRVTVSIGHAVFPLPPHQVRLNPEQALNLVDMALYTAKSQGRNRAVGIVQADAADAEGLRQLEGDFERAWREGQVSLRIDTGPVAETGRSRPVDLDSQQPKETHV
ncbi:GGDEF domain-containing protein [Aquabacterium sp.]|uniref:GGDEF domain-containing protein n=1 Tax=Aquabacterium sp. TaxID=1872578 RepID=UPI002C469CD5|nr:GGDEF domain-containing protein [Aquabacterium sp.]HSW05355.1 GGDEF domain-containing protein [Aquabacterium sp.]